MYDPKRERIERERRRIKKDGKEEKKSKSNLGNLNLDNRTLLFPLSLVMERMRNKA